jgi:hypothetical protein
MQLAQLQEVGEWRNEDDNKPFMILDLILNEASTISFVWSLISLK